MRIVCIDPGDTIGGWVMSGQGQLTFDSNGSAQPHVSRGAKSRGTGREQVGKSNGIGSVSNIYERVPEKKGVC